MNGERPALWRLIRDVSLTFAGIFMLLHETLATNPRFVVLVFALAVLAGPAAIRSVVAAYFGRGKE